MREHAEPPSTRTSLLAITALRGSQHRRRRMGAVDVGREFSIQPTFHADELVLRPVCRRPHVGGGRCGGFAWESFGAIHWCWRACPLEREMHDTLLQSLVGVALQFDAIARNLGPSSSAAREQPFVSRRQVETYIKEARQSIWDLRSPFFEALGFDPRSGSRRQCRRDKRINFHVTVTGTAVRGSAHVGDQLLRIGQEAISNAVRHAEAEHIQLDLAYDEQSTTLRVSDDGRGFDIVNWSRDTGRHFGLTTMRERAEQSRALRSEIETGAGHRHHRSRLLYRFQRRNRVNGRLVTPGHQEFACCASTTIGSSAKGFASVIDSEPDMNVIDCGGDGRRGRRPSTSSTSRHHADGSSAAGHGRRDAIRAIRRLDADSPHHRADDVSRGTRTSTARWTPAPAPTSSRTRWRTTSAHRSRGARGPPDAAAGRPGQASGARRITDAHAARDRSDEAGGGRASRTKRSRRRSAISKSDRAGSHQEHLRQAQGQ